MSIKLPQKYNDISSNFRRVVRNEYCKQQNGKCYYCDEDLEGPPSEKAQRMTISKKIFPKYFFNHPVHLHHCHSTGYTIGAVHSKCNAILWQYHKE